MKYGPLLASMLCLPAAAWAKDECSPTEEDPATRICIYQPHQRYVLHGLVGYPLNLEFGNGERIKRDDFAYTGQAFTKGCTLAAGQNCLEPAPTWKTVRAGTGDKEDKDRYVTNLPIWPFAAGHSSLVVVTATEAGAERPYLFDLWADDPAASCKENQGAPGCADDKTTVANISFAYPTEKAAQDSRVAQEKKKAAMVAWHQQQASRKEAEGVARLTQDVFYGQRQWSTWKIKGEPQFSYLDPNAVSDNGQVTLMQWPENVEVPTITIVNKNVTPNEVRIAPVSFHGRVAVIATTAEWFRLTLGKKAVHDLHNPAFSKDRPDPGTGTTSPDVLRTVIMQKAAR